MTMILRARSVMGSPGTASQRGAALAPGPRLLEGRGGGEDRRVGVPATHDLQANRQLVVGPARGHGGGGLAGEVERERERHPAEGRGGPAPRPPPRAPAPRGPAHPGGPPHGGGG